MLFWFARRVSVKSVMIGTAQGDMEIAVRSAGVFVVKSFAHKLGDSGKSFVGQRKFSELVGVLRFYHFQKHFLVFLGFGLHHFSVFKFQFYAFNKIAVIVKRLVELRPTFRASPIRRSEDFKTRHIPPAPADPFSFFPIFIFKLTSGPFI